MFERVLVAVDGSPCSDDAFGVARAMVNRELGHELTVVHVARSVNGRPLVTADDLDLRERLGQSVSKLLAEGVKTRMETPTAFHGGPAFAIAEVADEVDADVIVVGARGARTAGGEVLGDVPVRLLRNAGRPVLVIPMPTACFDD
ncbi:universal stress protein [Kineosporia sp. NBRC 101731]|uniref:universal stress protein n=1 Tax=Kineosporia sp. NBRC 101731 TaxID=3032199 RepID=UPI0024A1ED82|nr:universal stress protein [Kineosporia sp. NBRC 101731]GLY28830.1 hypothetical protein Kisp02_21950 [Kineosporia sp. NBRC 101731]